MEHYTEFFKRWPDGDDFAVLKRNSSGNEGFDDSFLGHLHERQLWAEGLYFELEAAIVSVGARYHDTPMPRGLVVWLHTTHNYIFGSLCYHRMPSDGFEIQNLDDEACFELADRINHLFHAVIAGVEPPISFFDPPNPLLAQE